MSIESLFDRDEFKVHAKQWHTRQKVLTVRGMYYDGTVYRSKYEGWRSWGLLGMRLYRGTKPLFLPFARAVDVDCGLIPAGWRFPEDSPPAWIEARDTVWNWSKWLTRGILYVHYGAALGLSGLRVADLRDEGRIIIDPISPLKFMLIYEGTYSLSPSMALFLERRVGEQGEEYEYAEVVTADLIRTFKDGQEFGFGGREASYPNALKFVPYVEVKHIENGQLLGAPTFDQAMDMLDQVNELESYLADIIKKHAEPQWVASGAQKGDLTKGDNVWYLPEGASITALVAGVDIGGVNEFIASVKADIKAALPETAFDFLKDKAQVATATLELQLGELTIKVRRTRPNYDAGLVEALQMAGRAAKTMGLSDVAPLDDEDLKLDDGRPVLHADLETREKADLLIKTHAPSEAIWELLNVKPETIEAWVAEKEARRDNFQDRLDTEDNANEGVNPNGANKRIAAG